MHPRDCPDFEYSDDPRKSRVFVSALADVGEIVRTARSVEIFADTRSIHRRLFRDLCPPGHEYYAGHYRGEDYRCLKFNNVTIPSDPRVGLTARRVPGEMITFGQSVLAEIAAVDSGSTQRSTTAGKAERLIFTVVTACRLFVRFLTIHPYVNGNGHVARFLLTGFLQRHGYGLKFFAIDPRPPDPPYSDLIKLYRDGIVEPFERYILEQIG